MFPPSLPAPSGCRGPVQSRLAWYSLSSPSLFTPPSHWVTGHVWRSAPPPGSSFCGPAAGNVLRATPAAAPVSLQSKTRQHYSRRLWARSRVNSSQIKAPGAGGGAGVSRRCVARHGAARREAWVRFGRAIAPSVRPLAGGSQLVPEAVLAGLEWSCRACSGCGRPGISGDGDGQRRGVRRRRFTPDWRQSARRRPHI